MWRAEAPGGVAPWAGIWFNRIMYTTWRQFVEAQAEQPYFRRLMNTVDAERRTKRPNPKRAQRQASRLAHRGRPSTASQAAIHADRERWAQRRAADAKQKKREVADAKYRLEREKAKARHRGH